MNGLRIEVMKLVKRKSHKKIYVSNQGWRTVGSRNIYFRSGWEVNYARYLQWLQEKGQILNWEHEPKTFWFEKIRRGTRSYLPDFKVTKLDGSHYWVEVKGYMDSKSVTKIKRFKKYYPEETLQIVDADWLYKNKSLIQMICNSQLENEFTQGEDNVD